MHVSVRGAIGLLNEMSGTTQRNFLHYPLPGDWHLLTVAPGGPGMWGFSDWGNNYFLLYAARKTGYQDFRQ
jgi:hypothetical protein